MTNIITVFTYISLTAGAIIITGGLIALALNVIAYLYQGFVGFNIFKKFLRKYHNEMMKEKAVTVDTSQAFKKAKKNCVKFNGGKND